MFRFPEHDAKWRSQPRAPARGPRIKVHYPMIAVLGWPCAMILKGVLSSSRLRYQKAFAHHDFNIHS